MGVWTEATAVSTQYTAISSNRHFPSSLVVHLFFFFGVLRYFRVERLGVARSRVPVLYSYTVTHGYWHGLGRHSLDISMNGWGKCFCSDPKATTGTVGECSVNGLFQRVN